MTSCEMIKIKNTHNSLLICFFSPLGVWSLWSGVPALLHPEIQLSGGHRTEGSQNKAAGLLCPQNQRLHWVHLCGKDQAVSNSFYRLSLFMNFRLGRLGFSYFFLVFPFVWSSDLFIYFSFFFFMTTELKDLMLLGKTTRSHRQR